jgi:hypothetical protein
MSSVLSVASITCLLLLSTIALTIVLRLSIGRFVFACAIFSSFSLLVYYSSAILHSGGGRLSKVCISMSALTGSIVLASLVCASILFRCGTNGGLSGCHFLGLCGDGVHRMVFVLLRTRSCFSRTPACMTT